MLVDTFTNPVAQVGQAEAAGIIVRSGTYGPRYYNAAEESWQDTPPVVELNAEIGVMVYAQNTAPFDQMMWASYAIYDPDGIEVATKESPAGICLAGGYFSPGIFIVTATKIGAYWVGVALYAEPL